jgi:hypothetical protein
MTQPIRVLGGLDMSRTRPLARFVPWVIGLSLLTILFTVPHSLEDFVYGLPGRFGVSVMLAGILLSLAFLAQIVGLLLVSHQRLSGFVITLAIALFWFAGAIADHLHDVLHTWPYREGIISKVMEVGIMASMAVLAIVSAVALYQSWNSRT